MSALGEIIKKPFEERTDIEYAIAAGWGKFAKGSAEKNRCIAAADELSRLLMFEKLAEKMADQLEVDNPNCEALTEYLLSTGQI
jgi:hypothetical protein